MKRWTDEDDLAFQSDYESGVAIENTSQRLGRSVSSLRQRASYMGLRRQPEYLSKVRRPASGLDSCEARANE